jgi:flagellar biosynthesis/type III secretory pathway chaperone
VNQSVAQLYQILQKLIGHHRQLMDVVRAEKQALLAADVKQIQDVVVQKQGIIEAIRQAEHDRVKAVSQLAIIWKKPAAELTLPNIIIALQGDDLKSADQLRGAFNTLTVMIGRISEANNDNRALVEKSIEHIDAMKKNVLGEAVPQANTYTQRGQKANSAKGARLISKEA